MTPHDSSAAGTRTDGMLNRCVSALVDDIDALPLRVFEILFTSAFLLRMGWLGLSWGEWLTAEGFHLNAAELAALGCPEPLPLLNAPGVAVLAAVICLSAAGLMLNKARRLALLGLFVCALYTQGAAKQLVDLARKESDATLKGEMVKRLANMKAKEATDFTMELLNK